MLVAASTTVAAIVALAGRSAGASVWLTLPVTLALALAVTQLLALGMTAPLREMTAAARRMAQGDYDVRITPTSRDEVGELTRAFTTMSRDLATVDAQRRELVATVSHELRTPLAAQRAVLENLADGIGGADGLDLAVRQAERLSQLVEDLLDLARVDAGKAPLATSDVALAGFLADVVADAEATGRDVRYDLDVEPGLVVSADPGRLHQLVANLLDNASRHSPAGGTVTVRALREPGGANHYVLEVADQGEGIAPADRERVFERFGTVGATDGGGTGLGLAIARWVTDLHGGSISFVDPAPGATGARARVVLPLTPPVRPAPKEAPVTTTVPEGPATAIRPSPPAPPISDDLFGGFWPDGTPGRLSLLAGSLGVGLLAAIVLPERNVGLGWTLLVLAAGAVVLGAARDRRDPFTLACAGLCGLLALVPVVRAAEWLTPLSLLAGGTLMVAGVTRGRTLPGFVVAGLSWPLAGLRGLPWLGRTLALLTGLGHGAALLRTVVLSVVGLLVFGLLFASADALFAEWAGALVPDADLDSFVLRAFITIAVGGVVLAAAYLALNPPRVDRAPGEPRPVAHRFEWLAPVVVVDLVFAAFLIAQAAVIFGGHDYLERTTGLTYADYVHQGFGQLTIATALTLLVVWSAARKAPRATYADRAWLRAALGVLCAQTLVVVASALHRMHVYQEAYGFTELRLLVDVFEGWLGLLVLAVAVAGWRLRATWLPRFALISGAVAFLGVVALNPEAWVAERNLDRYAETGKIDTGYLNGLSDDAVPALVDAPEEIRDCLLVGRTEADEDWLEWNLGRALAAEHLGVEPWPGEELACPAPS
nr:DUF4153 domain-containing protein [Nocardioides thalensis]